MSKTRKQRYRRRQAAQKYSESFSEIEWLKVDLGERAVRYSLAAMATFALAIGEEVEWVCIGPDVTPEIRFSENGSFKGFILDPSGDESEFLRRCRPLNDASMEVRMRAAVAQIGVIHAGIAATVIASSPTVWVDLTNWAGHLRDCLRKQLEFFSWLYFDDEVNSWELNEDALEEFAWKLVFENWPNVAFATWEGSDRTRLVPSEVLSPVPDFPELALTFWEREDDDEFEPRCA